MWNRTLLSLTALLAAACAQQVTGVDLDSTFEHRVATTQIEIQWNCVPESGGLTVEGVVRNTSSIDLKFVELDLVAANAQGAAVSQAKAAIEPVVLTMRAIGPFRMHLAGANPDTHVDLFYQFRIGVRLDYQRFSARNICSPTALRAR